MLSDVIQAIIETLTELKRNSSAQLRIVRAIECCLSMDT